MSDEAKAALTLTATVDSVTITSPPVVRFTVKDAAGNGIKGMGVASGANLSHLRFTIAKLVPGANGSPDQWVSYMVTATSSPTSERVAANLVDHGDGSYVYTFAKDITDPSVTGGVTYEPTRTHRLAIQMSGIGNAPKNPIYDFVPATPGIAPTFIREITTTATCNKCHGTLALHGSRVEVQYCVVCHTDQLRNGAPSARIVTSTGNAFDVTKQQSIADGTVLGDFIPMVHQIHMGHKLTKTGYNFRGVLYNHITYPQPQTNCAACHTASAATPQGDNWMSKPSRLACGACHDGINWANGTGTTVKGATTGHIGGRATSDAVCYICHDAVSIPVYHVTVDPTGSSGRAGYPVNTAVNVPTPGYPSGQGPSIPLASRVGTQPAGVYKIDYEIKQVTVTGAAGAKKANVVYRILKDGQPVTLNAAGNLIDNLAGSPSIYVAYALAQDGIANPADWTTNISATVTQFRDNSVVGGGALSQTGPDASGYYTATFFAIIPDAAKMVTGGIGFNYQGFVQLNLSAYPNGIRLREPANVIKTADGFTARRSIVSNAKCNDCHGQLGISPSFHGGARNNGAACAICHNYSNSNATGHIGANYSYGGGWSVSTKDMVHAIHASAKREQAFNYEATIANPDGFAEVTYPGILNKCEQCHVAGSYDFRTTANAAAVPNLLWSTAAKGNMTAPAGFTAFLGLSPWIPIPAGNYTGAIGVASRANNLVISPISASCFGCHDSAAAVAHMRFNGGVIYGAITTDAVGLASGVNPETCMICHGSGKSADIAVVHK